MTADTTNGHTEFGVATWLKWVIATTSGYLISDIFLEAVNRSNLCRGIAGLAAMGAAIGVSAAAMQWLVLRRQLARPGWWVVLSGLGWSIGYATNWQLCLDPPPIFPWVNIGLLVGVFQWPVLQTRASSLKSLIVWPVASVLGIAFGYFGLTALISSLELPSYLLAPSRILGYALLGVITGDALFFLFRSPKVESSLLTELTSLLRKYPPLRLALFITLLTGLRGGSWSTGFIGGIGYGFPWLWFRVATWSDAGGIVIAADRSAAIFLAAISFAGDLIFWFGFLHLVLWIAAVFARDS